MKIIGLLLIGLFIFAGISDSAIKIRKKIKPHSVKKISAEAQSNKIKIEPAKILASKKKKKTLSPRTKQVVSKEAYVKIEKKKEIPRNISRDLFQVDFMMNIGESEDNTVIEKAKVNLSVLVLQGIIVSGRRSIALINDLPVALGEYISGWKLIGIKKDRIGLKKDGEIKILYLKLGE